MNITYYEILGLKVKSNKKDILKNYNQIIKYFKNVIDNDLILKEIEISKDFLLNKEKRDVYDQNLTVENIKNTNENSLLFKKTIIESIELNKRLGKPVKIEYVEDGAVQVKVEEVKEIKDLISINDLSFISESCVIVRITDALMGSILYENLNVTTLERLNPLQMEIMSNLTFGRGLTYLLFNKQLEHSNNNIKIYSNLKK